VRKIAKEEEMYARSLLSIAIAMMITIILLGQGSPQESKQKATEAAEDWLLLVDEGKWAESWESLSSLARSKVGKDQWVQSVGSAREMFGGLLNRTVKTQEYTTTMPGAPDGHYVIIQFETSFEKKQSAIETVTPMLDPDGNWRVSGYFIR
jgi:hypothetical protein